MLLDGYDLMLVKQILLNAKRDRRSAPIAEAMWESHLESLAQEEQEERAARLSSRVSGAAAFSRSIDTEEMHVLEPERSVGLAEEVCFPDDDTPEFADRSGWMRFECPDTGRSRFLTR